MRPTSYTAITPRPETGAAPSNEALLASLGRGDLGAGRASLVDANAASRCPRDETIPMRASPLTRRTNERSTVTIRSSSKTKNVDPY